MLQSRDQSQGLLSCMESILVQSPTQGCQDLLNEGARNLWGRDGREMEGVKGVGGMVKLVTTLAVGKVSHIGSSFIMLMFGWAVVAWLGW